jgi:HK97 family phage major capsid protein
MDIQNKADALKVLSDLKTEQRRLSDANRDLTENMEAKAADLKAVQQKLAEMSAPKVVTVSEKEATLRKFVGADGSLDVAGMASDEVDRGDWHSEFKRLVDDRNLAKLMTKSGNVPKLDAKLNMHMASAPSDVRRAFSDASTVGSEWVPDLVLPTLMQKLHAPRAVESLFNTMTMPGKEVRLPFLTLQVKPYLKSGATWGSTITVEDDTTSQISLTAQSLAARIQVDEDASADSIVAGLDYARQSLSAAIADAVEDAICNGDTAGTHQDAIASWNPRSRWNASGLGTNDHRSAWLGLRAQANDVSATRDATADSDHYAGILTTRALLDGASGVGNNLALVCSTEYYIEKILALDEVATIDKMGPSAVVLSGQVASLAGMAVVPSDFFTNDLASNGLYTGSGDVTGYAIVNRSAYVMGNYKPVDVQFQREIVNGVVDVVVNRRCIFKCLEEASKTVAYAYNI